MRSCVMRRCRRESGQSLVEVALVFPVLLMLLLGLLDFGRAFYAVVSLRDAADEGAAYASLDPSNTAEIVQRAVAASPRLVQITEDGVTVHQPAVIAPGQAITVTVQAEMMILTPFVQGLVEGGSLTLEGQSSHPILMVP